MSRTSFVLSLLPLLTGCVSDKGPPDQEPPVSSDPLTSLSDPQALPEAATLWSQQIVRFEDLSQACAEVTGWTATRLFPEASSESALQRWCLYSAPAAPSTKDEVQDLIKAAEGLRLALVALDPKVSVGPDRLVVQAASWEEELGSALERRFFARTGALRYEGAVDEARPVRLSVLDTSPTSQGVDALTGGEDAFHGFSLSNLAWRQLCAPFGGAPESCPVALHTQQALPRVFGALPALGRSLPTYNPKRTLSTRVGAFQDVAQAINREVADWQGAGAEQHLILNLSLGWSTVYGPAEGGPGVEAVRDALRNARCQGAAVFAAAGNRGAGGGKDLDQSLLYPAAWHSESLRKEDCEGLLFGGAEWPYSSETAPLLLAVGALSAEGRSLSLTRGASTPDLAAPGDHAVARRFKDGAALRPMTGTSVSTLIVSTSAAALWASNPNWSATELEGALRDAAPKK